MGVISDALGIVPAGRSLPLVFGSAFHKGMEALMTGKSIDEAVNEAKAYAINEDLITISDTKRNITTLEIMLRDWEVQNRTSPNRASTVVIDDTPLVEASFCFKLADIDGYEVMWAGTIDAVVRRSDGLWVMDHKTTSRLGETFADDKQRSDQMLGYVWAAQQISEVLREPIKGVLINAASMQSKGPVFQTYPLPYAPSAVDAWLEDIKTNLHFLIKELEEFDFGNNHVRTNRESCVKKYGKCPYFDVCQYNEAMRAATLLSGAYQKTDYRKVKSS